MASEKMYRVDRMVNLPDGIGVSDVMYKTNSFYNLPGNMKETYYQDQIPEVKPKANGPANSKMDRPTDSFSERNGMIPESSGKTNMEELRHRQENVLEKLKQIKEKLNNLKGIQFVFQSGNAQAPSSTNINSLTEAQEKQGFSLIRKIEALKNQLLDAKRMRNRQEQQSVEQMERWQKFILSQLLCLRDEMKSLAKQNQTVSVLSGEEDLKGRQRDIVQIIDALQALMKTEISSLQADIQKSGVIQDLVVSANPANPPYFLLPIKKLLQSNCSILSTSCTHSSVDNVDANVLTLFKDDELKERRNHDVAFTVIWKNQTMKSLMVSPLKQSSIIGEANILRYISRLFPAVSALSYESQGSFANISETDYWLDTIQSKFLHGNNKERQSFLKRLNSKLGTSAWFDGNAFGLCDVFSWSVILQLGLTDVLPSNVSSWFKRMTEASGLEAGFINQVNRGADLNKENKSLVNRKGLEDFLKKNDIHFQSRDHKEVFTVDTLMECVKDMPGIHMKNLFLKDKKKNLYLLAARHDAQVQLNDVGNQIGAKDLRFGNEDSLFETLGVKQGCVTLFALLNDSNHEVTLLLDAEVVKTDLNFVNFHPMTNAATLGISPQDLQKFLKLTGHKVHLINL